MTRTFWYLGPQAFVVFRMLQIVDKLHNFDLCFFQACNIIEPHTFPFTFRRINQSEFRTGHLTKAFYVDGWFHRAKAADQKWEYRAGQEQHQQLTSCYVATVVRYWHTVI